MGFRLLHKDHNGVNPNAPRPLITSVNPRVFVDYYSQLPRGKDFRMNMIVLTPHFEGTLYVGAATAHDSRALTSFDLELSAVFDAKTHYIRKSKLGSEHILFVKLRAELNPDGSAGFHITDMATRHELPQMKANQPTKVKLLHEKDVACLLAFAAEYIDSSRRFSVPGQEVRDDVEINQGETPFKDKPEIARFLREVMKTDLAFLDTLESPAVLRTHPTQDMPPALS